MAADHLIRLRGGWQWVDPVPPPQLPGYLRLPIEWPPALRAPFRLVRRFGYPPLLKGESVWLRLGDVPGLTGLWLNEQPLSWTGVEAGPVEICLDARIAERNALVLAVDPRLVPSAGRTWGSIALVVRTPGPG